MEGRGGECSVIGVYCCLGGVSNYLVLAELSRLFS